MKKMFSYLKPYWVTAFLSPITMIGEVLADLSLPYLMSFIINYGIAGIDINDPKKGSAIAAAFLTFFKGTSYTRMDIILTFGIMMLIVTFLGGTCGILCAYLSSHASQNMGNDLRFDAYQHIMALSIQQTDKFTTGSLITRMTNDVTMVVEFMEMFMRGFFRSAMFLIGGTIMLLLLDLTFGMVLLCTMPILIAVLWLVLSRAIPLYSIVQKKLDKVNSVVQENITGARMVKACVRENYECKRFGQANEELCGVNEHVLKIMAVIPPVLTVLLNGAVIAVLYIGGADIKNGVGGMTTGAVMAAITYVTQVIQSIMMVTGLFQSVSRANASAIRLNEVLSLEPAILSGNKNADSIQAAVCFNHVTFHYPGTHGAPVLKDICLTVNRGERLAIIGATGCGKTSLLSLIPRFYDPDNGSVCIDGLSVKEYDLKKLRQKIGYVMQKSELFSDTISNNILWGKPEATEEEIKKATDIAQASDYICSFHEKYQSFVAEKGASLSGGQKQRLSIARALIRKPEILILDDSTSALDLETESHFHAALKKELKNTTIIMVAQRIASVKDADRIAVMENDGEIKYCAPHEELLQISETYRSIYQSQRRTVLSNDPTAQVIEKEDTGRKAGIA